MMTYFLKKMILNITLITVFLNGLTITDLNEI